MGFACFTVWFGSRILLLCFICQLIDGRGLEKRIHSSTERAAESNQALLPRIDSGIVFDLQHILTDENTKERGSDQTLPNECFGDLIWEPTQPNPDDVDEDLQRRAGLKYMSNYILKIYSSMREIDLVQDRRDAVTVITHRGSAIEPFSEVPSRRRYMSFKTEGVPSGDVTRYEIVVKLNQAEQRSIHDTFYLKVNIGDGKYFKAQRYENYLIFNITSEKDSLPETLLAQQSILVENPHGEKTTLPLACNNEPVLAVYQNIDFNPLFKSQTRDKRSANTGSADPDQANDDVHKADAKPPHPDGLCTRHDWDLNMTFFSRHWNGYLLPHSYNAGYCKGTCSSAVTDKINTTNHAFLRLFLRDMLGPDTDNIPEVCCTPVEYNSLTILYVDQSYNVVSAQLPEASVASCGCR